MTAPLRQMFTRAHLRLAISEHIFYRQSNILSNMSRLHETADSEKKNPGIWWKLLNNSWTKTMNGFFFVDIFSKISSVFDDVEISDDDERITTKIED